MYTKLSFNAEKIGQKMKEGGPLLKASYSLMCLYFIKASLKNVVHETDTFFLEKKTDAKNDAGRISSPGKTATFLRF